jgi:hypothetical protein
MSIRQGKFHTLSPFKLRLNDFKQNLAFAQLNPGDFRGTVFLKLTKVL